MDAESLIRTLREYDSSIDAAAVRAAISGTQSSDLIRWATAHLTPDTLLSEDELSQYAALEESGLVESLAKSADLTASRVLGDQELKDAIEELNRSTQAITRHTETLKQQQEALVRLTDNSRQGAQDRAAAESLHGRKSEAQRRDLASTTNELSRSLKARVVELEQQSTGAESAIQETVDTLFRSDDKLLSSLQKLGLELQSEDAEEQENVTALRETCARLIKFTVEGLRTKLDRIYLECLEHSAHSGASARVSADEVSALQEELESLYAEILPVAQMSAEQQFLEPALKSLAVKNGEGLARSAQGTSYVHDCLDYLIDRAQDLMARLEAFQAYQLASNAVLDIAKSELASEAAAGAAHARQKSLVQQEAMSPVRPRPKQRQRYSIGEPGISHEPPLDEIMRNLALTLPEEDGAPADVQVQARDLAHTLAARRAKLHDVTNNVQETFEGAAAKHVVDGKLAIQLVRESILAESPFGPVRLVDPEIESSIAVLSQELANTEEKLKGVDADVAKLRGKNVKRDEIISRWGS